MAETKISITPISLRNQKPTDIKEGYIELCENHFHYKIEFYADEPKDENDLNMGWDNNIYNHYDIIALKKNIAGIEKSFTKDKKWGIYILVDGFSNDIKVYFKSQTSAQELLDKIKEWLLK